MIIAPELKLHWTDLEGDFGFYFHTARIGSLRHFAESHFTEAAPLYPQLRAIAADKTLGSGMLPVATTLENGDSILRWVIINRKNSARRTLEARVAADRRSVSVRSPEFGALRLRWGMRGEFEFSPPAWPNAPLVNLPEYNVMDFFRLLRSSVELAVTHAEEKSEKQPNNAAGEPEESVYR